MTLSQRVEEDLKSAMKARQEIRVSTLRLLKAEAANAAIRKGKQQLEDGEVLEVIGKLMKQRDESIEAFTQGNRPELAEKERKEAAVLQAYLPSALSQEELKEIIQSAIREAGAGGPQAFGAVMKAVMPKVAGRADGKGVSQLVKELLGA